MGGQNLGLGGQALALGGQNLSLMGQNLGHLVAQRAVHCALQRRADMELGNTYFYFIFDKFYLGNSTYNNTNKKYLSLLSNKRKATSIFIDK